MRAALLMLGLLVPDDLWGAEFTYKHAGQRVRVRAWWDDGASIYPVDEPTRGVWVTKWSNLLRCPVKVT